MTSIQHLFFLDECLPPELGETYLVPHAEVAGVPIKVVHYTDKYGNRGRWKDDDFVPDLARDPKWVIFSADKNQDYDGLRAECRRCGVTLIYLSQPLKKKGVAFYGPQFLVHWANIIKAGNGPRGVQYLAHLHNETMEMSDTVLMAGIYRMGCGSNPPDPPTHC